MVKACLESPLFKLVADTSINGKVLSAFAIVTVLPLPVTVTPANAALFAMIYVTNPELDKLGGLLLVSNLTPSILKLKSDKSLL